MSTSQEIYRSTLQEIYPGNSAPIHELPSSNALLLSMYGDSPCRYPIPPSSSENSTSPETLSPLSSIGRSLVADAPASFNNSPFNPPMDLGASAPVDSLARRSDFLRDASRYAPPADRFFRSGIPASPDNRHVTSNPEGDRVSEKPLPPLPNSSSNFLFTQPLPAPESRLPSRRASTSKKLRKRPPTELRKWPSDGRGAPENFSSLPRADAPQKLYNKGKTLIKRWGSGATNVKDEIRSLIDNAKEEDNKLIQKIASEFGIPKKGIEHGMEYHEEIMRGLCNSKREDIIANVEEEYKLIEKEIVHRYNKKYEELREELNDKNKFFEFAVDKETQGRIASVYNQLQQAKNKLSDARQTSALKVRHLFESPRREVQRNTVPYENNEQPRTPLRSPEPSSIAFKDLVEGLKKLEGDLNKADSKNKRAQKKWNESLQHANNPNSAMLPQAQRNASDEPEQMTREVSDPKEMQYVLNDIKGQVIELKESIQLLKKDREVIIEDYEQKTEKWNDLVQNAKNPESDLHQHFNKLIAPSMQKEEYLKKERESALENAKRIKNETIKKYKSKNTESGEEAKFGHTDWLSLQIELAKILTRIDRHRELDRIKSEDKIFGKHNNVTGKNENIERAIYNGENFLAIQFGYEIDLEVKRNLVTKLLSHKMKAKVAYETLASRIDDMRQQAKFAFNIGQEEQGPTNHTANAQRNAGQRGKETRKPLTDTFNDNRSDGSVANPTIPPIELVEEYRRTQKARRHAAPIPSRRRPSVGTNRDENEFVDRRSVTPSPRLSLQAPSSEGRSPKVHELSPTYKPSDKLGSSYVNHNLRTPSPGVRDRHTLNLSLENVSTASKNSFASNYRTLKDLEYNDMLAQLNKARIKLASADGKLAAAEHELKVTEELYSQAKESYKEWKEIEGKYFEALEKHDQKLIENEYSVYVENAKHLYLLLEKLFDMQKELTLATTAYGRKRELLSEYDRINKNLMKSLVLAAACSELSQMGPGILQAAQNARTAVMNQQFT